MSNLFDILSLRHDKTVPEKSVHGQVKDKNAISDDRASKSSSLDVSEHLGTQDRRKRRSTSAENVEVAIDDEPYQGQQADNQTAEEKIYELDSLKQFTIPKKRKTKKELLESISITSREFQQDILPVIKQTFKDRNADKYYNYTSVQLVHNKHLLNRFQEKRKELRGQGYNEKEVSDSYAYFCVDTFWQARDLCEKGFSVGNANSSCLGNPELAVCLSRHPDVIRPMGMTTGYTGRLLVCKIIKGKVKAMVENRGEIQLDPTPNFDCHVSKTPNVDVSVTGPLYAYEATQIYVYEYDDLMETEKKPRQIYPYAVVTFTYNGPTKLQKPQSLLNQARTPSGMGRMDPRTVQPMQRQSSDPRYDHRMGGEPEPRESKLKDLRLTGNPRDPRLSTSDPRSYRRHSSADHKPEPQAAAWDPVASARPPSSGGAVPLSVQKGHGSNAIKPGMGRPSPASASGKPSPVSAAKPSSGSTKSPSGGTSGYSSSGKPSPVSSTGGPPSPFTKPVMSPALSKPQGSPGSRRRYSGSSQSMGKPVSPGTTKPSQLSVLQSHLQDAGEASAVSERIGGEVEHGGCVVWEGELSSKNTDLCRVNMVAFGTSIKPARIGEKLNIASRIPVDLLGDKHMTDVVSLSRDTETRIGAKFYNYCTLQPTSDSDSNKFLQLVSYLTANQSASVVKLEYDVDLIIIPPCEKSMSLGLMQDYNNRNVMHCIFVSGNSRHLQYQGRGSSSVSEPASPATPLGPYNRTPQTSPGASGGSVHSPANSHPAQSPSGFPGYQMGGSQGHMLASPNQHQDHMGRPSNVASGAGDPWVAQSTPNDLASVKLVPLDGGGEDTSVQDENVFKEPPQPTKIVKDAAIDAIYDEGFKQHIPVESLIFRDNIVQAFKQQETSQDHRNQELARKSKHARAKGVPSLGGKPVMSLPNKMSGSSGSSKSVPSPSSSKPMLSPQSQSTPSPLASMENMFKSHASPQTALADGYHSSGIVPDNPVQHSRQHMPSSSIGYNRQMGMHGGPSMIQGDMLSQTHADLQYQIPGPNMLGPTGHVGMPMPDMNDQPPSYTQHQYGQQQSPDLQPQYYHQQHMQQRQQYPYQQQFGPGPNAYDQQLGYQQHMGYQHGMPGMHISPPAKTIPNDPRLMKRHSHQQHLLQQGGLPPGNQQISPPISESLLRRQLTMGSSSSVLQHSQLGPSSINASHHGGTANSSLSPNLYPSSADMNATPLPLDNFSGDLQGLHTSTQQQFSHQPQPQVEPQLPLQDPLFSGQNLPKSLSVGPTPGTQESSPTPGIISSQASGVTKPRPTEGLTTDPLMRNKPGEGDKRGLVTKDSVPAISSDSADSLKLLDPNILDVIPGTKTVEELERELDELKRLSEKTEQDIEAFNIKARKRIERGNSSDSMVSSRSGKSSPDPVNEASDYLHRAKQMLSGQGELTDDIVDAIVKAPILKNRRPKEVVPTEDEPSNEKDATSGQQLCDIDFPVPTAVKQKEAHELRGRTTLKKIVSKEKSPAEKKVDALIAESAQEMRALLEETIAGEEPYSPHDASETGSERNSEKGTVKGKSAVPANIRTSTDAAAKDQPRAENIFPNKQKLAPVASESQSHESQTSPQALVNCSSALQESSPSSPPTTTPEKSQQEPLASTFVTESPESPPQDEGPTLEGHLLLKKAPAKRLYPASFVNNKTVKDTAAFMNMTWPSPGLVGGAAIKQESNVIPEVTGEEKQLSKMSHDNGEPEGSFKVPDSVKVQKRRKKKEYCSAVAPVDGQNDYGPSKESVSQHVRIPIDVGAKQSLDEFIMRHELDDTTIHSRVLYDLDRGDSIVSMGKVEIGSGPRDVSVTLENEVTEGTKELVTAETAICKAMCSALHRRDPDAVEETTLAERDWIQWWMWSLHYALWNMEATDEVKARIQEDKENNTAAPLTRREGDSRVFWLRPMKGEKVTIMDERTICVSDSSALCLPEGVDTVNLTCSISEEWRNTQTSCATCGLVEVVQCQCHGDRRLIVDDPVESPSPVLSPFPGLGSPPVDQSSVAGDLDDASNLDDLTDAEQAGDPDSKWWLYLSQPAKADVDSFSVNFTVDALSAALEHVTTSESTKFTSAPPKQVVPNASTNLSTNAESPVPRKESLWTNVYDILNDLVDSSTEIRSGDKNEDSDYESSDDSLNMSETLSDVNVKLMETQEVLRKADRVRLRNSGYMSSLFGSDTSISTSGDESDDSATASMPPSTPGSPDESVQWMDENANSQRNGTGDATRMEFENLQESLTETSISPMSPTFHRKLLESLELLGETEGVKDKNNNTIGGKGIENVCSGNKENVPTVGAKSSSVSDINAKISFEKKASARKILNEILCSPNLSPQPQVIQVYHLTTSPTQSPKSPANESNESPAQPPSASPTSPTSVGPSTSTNPDAAGQGSGNSSRTSTPFEGAGDSKNKDVEKPKEAKKEERKETEEERRRRKEKKKKKKHKHDSDRDRSSDKHDRKDRDKEKERDKNRDKDKDREKNKDRDKERERRRKEERERERSKKDKERKSGSSSKSSSKKPSPDSIKQLGNILSNLPVEVTAGKASSTVKQESKADEIEIDLGTNFILEDAQLALGKDMAQILTTTSKRVVSITIASDSSEDEREAKKKEALKANESNSIEVKSEKNSGIEIKKEPIDQTPKSVENGDSNTKAAENGSIVKEETPEIKIKKEETDAKMESDTKKDSSLVWVSADTGNDKKSEGEVKKETDTSNAEGTSKSSDGADAEKKDKKDRHYRYKIITKGLTLRSPLHAKGLYRKFKVEISRKEKKRAIRAGKRNFIKYTDEIRQDLIKRRGKYTTSSVPSHPKREPVIANPVVEVKKERRAMIIDDDSDDDNAAQVKKEPGAPQEVKKPVLERLEESVVKKEKKEEERPGTSEQSSAEKLLIDKLKREHQERLKEKAKALAGGSTASASTISSSSSSASSYNSKVNDFLARKIYKRYRKRYNLKMCAVSISSKEKRRAEKMLHRLEGTLYWLKIMREGKLARERVQGFKRPADVDHTSQPKRYKSGGSGAAWRAMPSFKIRKAGQDSDGFKIPRPREEHRKMSEDKENEEMEEIEEGFFTEEELKAKERGNKDKKKEKDEQADKAEKQAKGAEMRKRWKKDVLRKVVKTGAIIFEFKETPYTQGRRDEHKFQAYTGPPQEDAAKLKIIDPVFQKYRKHRDNQELLTMLTHEGVRRQWIPYTLPPPLGTRKRFAEYNFKRNIVEILDKEDREEFTWKVSEQHLAAKQKLLDELDKEKQETPAMDVDDLEQMYGQGDDQSADTTGGMGTSSKLGKI